MKKKSYRNLLLSASLALISFQVNAAEEQNIRYILDSQNVLTTNQGDYIDTVYGQTSEMLIYSIDLKPQNIKGLKLRIKGKIGNTLRYTSYISGFEIPALIKALDKMIAAAENNKDKDVNIEMNYRTKDGINFVYYHENRNPKFYIEAGSLESFMAGYTGVSKFTSSANVDLDIKEFKKIKDVLDMYLK